MYLEELGSCLEEGKIKPYRDGRKPTKCISERDWVMYQICGISSLTFWTLSLEAGTVPGLSHMHFSFVVIPENNYLGRPNSRGNISEYVCS